MLRGKAIDVVITDLLMPLMDGRELMKWAKEHCPDPKWIVLSSLDTFDVALDAMHLGAFDFLAKPPQAHRIQVAARNALDQLELARDRERLYQEVEHKNAELAHKVEQLSGLCRMLEEQAAVIQGDLERAEIIQRALLPKAPPDLGDWRIETLFRPGSNVGGDFYDIVAFDGRHAGLVVADAAGHGVAAAMLSVLFKHRLELRDAAAAPLPPAEVLEHVNRRLCPDMRAPGSFITALYMLLDRDTGSVRIASAGHPPCVWAKASGSWHVLERTGPALGLEESAAYTEHALELGPGDRLLLYTDGVLDGATAGGPEGLGRLLGAADDSHDLLSRLYEAAKREAPADRDDITMILLERSTEESHFDATVEPRDERGQAPPVEYQGRILRGAADGSGYLCVAGRGSWMRSSVFLEAASELLREQSRLVIDLSRCQALDSTFLGTLYEVVASAPDRIVVQSVPARIEASFRELSMKGVLEHISPTACSLPEGMQPVLRSLDGEAERGRLLRAHEVLASLSDENREQFEDVVAMLRKEGGAGPT